MKMLSCRLIDLQQTGENFSQPEAHLYGSTEYAWG